MNPRHRMSLVAGAATLLSTAPLATVFDKWTWAIDVIFAVAAVVGVAMLARQLRAPVWAQVLAMLGALTIVVTWFFGGGTALAGTIPTLDTLRHWTDLANSAGNDVRDLAVPVPDRQGLLFFATAGVGLVAIVVDVCAVGLRRPALAGMAMLPLYSIPVMVHSDSVMFLSFVVAAAGYLWLLAADSVERVRRFGRRFTGDGRDVDAWEPSPLAAAGRRLAVVGVIVAVLLPLVVPGMTGGLLDRFGNGAGDGNGVGSGSGGASVSLFAQLSGQLNLKQSFPMLKVTNSDPDPYYLRFGVADQVTASGFRNHVTRNGQSVNSTLPNPTLNAVGVTQHSYHASVEVVNLDMGLLPIYTQLTKAQKLDNKWGYDADAGIVYSNRASSKNKKYSFDYVHTTFTAQALRNAPALADDDPMVQTYTAVPQIQLITDKVAALTAGEVTEYDRVRALYDYFSSANGFTYSLSTRSGTSGSDIVDFLTGKTGYCEQYAAALAWLVRQAHIPARVAFGYTRGGSRAGQTYTLTNLNLHAWTEVYFPGYGWVPFDATPPSHVSGSAPTDWAPDANAPTDSPSTGPGVTNPNGNSSDGPQGAAPTQKVDPGQEGQAGGGGPLRSDTAQWPWWVLGGAILVLIMLSLPALRRATMRRRRLPAQVTRAARGRPAEVASAGSMRVLTADDPDSDLARATAHQAWDELVDTLVDFRVPVDEAATPRTTAAQVIDRLRLTGTTQDGTNLVAQAEERARYARTPLAGVDLSGPVRDIRRALKRHVSRRTRISAALFPRSVLARWRGRANATVLAVNTTVSRVGEMLAAGLNPRRLFASRSR
jgi:TgpA N-terminal domain/Transglutaminase-like superfamily